MIINVVATCSFTDNGYANTLFAKYVVSNEVALRLKNKHRF